MGTKYKTNGKSMVTVTNFGRFYASFNLLPWSGDREDFKKVIVQEYTQGRTSSLKEMTKEEYDACCETLEKMSGRKDQLKKERSQCLHQMQKLGIHTDDWAQVNSFCQNPKIAGKVFARLTIEELRDLSKRMRAIATKGWERKDKEPAKQTTPMYVLMLDTNNTPS